MSANTSIEWCDHTFNPVWGCERSGPECAQCYAADWAKRWGYGWGRSAPRRTFGDKHWAQLKHWNAAAKAKGKRESVFVGSMCDIGEDHPVTRAEVGRLWPIVRECEWLYFLCLTKRPQNYPAILPIDWRYGYENVGLGTSCGHYKWTHRIKELLRVPAKMRFLSCEPLITTLHLDQYVFNRQRAIRDVMNGPLALSREQADDCLAYSVDWVICGGESGPGARPMHPDWARGLRDQCQAAGVPYFFKQWGSFTPERPEVVKQWTLIDRHGNRHENTTAWNGRTGKDSDTGEVYMYPCDKKSAGRMLDGREWNELPEAIAR